MHSSTGVAPYRLILNNSIDLDRGLFVSISPSSAELKQPLGKFAAEMLQKQAQLIHFADTKLRAHDAILDLQNNTESIVHIERLSPFAFDYIYTDPK